jgi:Putative prokaryotic signal transducing protein
MVEIERTSDPVRLSFLRSMLQSAGIRSFVFEPNVGGLWPGAVATRLMVADDDQTAARKAIEAADPKEVWR